MDLAIQHGHQDITALLRLSSAPETPQSKPNVDQRVAWSPPGISAPIELLAVMIPPGQVTERQWLEALGDRVTQMVLDDPQPEAAAEDVARMLDRPTPDSPQAAGEYLVTENFNLRTHLNLATEGLGPFPGQASEMPEAREAIEQTDLWLWADIASSMVSTSSLD